MRSTLPLFLMKMLRKSKKCSRKVPYSTNTCALTVKDNAVDPLAVLSDRTLSYQEIFFSLHQQARKSIFLHVNNAHQQHLAEQLYKFCSQMGNVVYIGAIPDVTNYFIVEYSNEDGVSNLLSMSKDGPLNLRMAELSPTMNLHKVNKESKQISHFHDDELLQSLTNAKNLDHQIHIYFNMMRSTSEHVRKNLLITSIFQDFFNWHMKTDFTAVPFGSSFSCFSSSDSDVDISLTDLRTAGRHDKKVSSISSLNQIPSKSAKMYKSLHRRGTNTLFTQACKHFINHFPGVSKVSSHDAVVPLITMYLSSLSTNIDISMDNRSGVQMGWILNIYTRLDDRVGPFLFLIRQWGKQQGITIHGGLHYDGMTPFMLICLALFYLMRIEPSVLPSIDDIMISKMSSEDIILGGFRTKLIQDISVFKKNNSMTVDELFIGFLNYYRRFNFVDLGLNLIKGVTFSRCGQTLLIITPLQSGNIGKVCSLKSMKKFQNHVEILLRKLEGRRRNKTKLWGILSTIDPYYSTR